MIDIPNIEKKIISYESILNTKREDLKVCEHTIENLLNEIDILREGQAIVQSAAKVTQESLEVQLSNSVSALLSGVLDDPYTFKVDFIPKRNSMECNLLFEKSDGKEIRSLKPLEGCGHGAADLASIGLKTSFNMLKDNCRNTIIVDEPFRALSRERHPLAAKVLKEISEELNIQIIVVTHTEALAKEADRVFVVKKEGNTSIVEEE